MNNHKIDSTHNIYSISKIISSAEESEVVLTFGKDVEIYKNALNLITLQKLAEDKGKTVKFVAENKDHREFINSVNNGYIEYSDDEINLDEEETSYSNPLSGLFSAFGKKKEGKSLNADDEDDNREGTNSELKSKRKKLLKVGAIVLGALLLFFGSIIFAWWYIPSATIKLAVDSQGLIKLLDVSAVRGETAVSTDNMIIPAFEVEVTETDSLNASATGTKEVGEYAIGEVTITNKTDRSVRIRAGTVIRLISTDRDTLIYETTEEVTVPGYEEEEEETETGAVVERIYGKADVEIKAVSFGETYNLSGGRQFEVGTYSTSEVLAENPAGIRGGTFEEVSVVSQEDLDNLRRSLENSVQDKVLDALRRRLVSGQTMQESSATFEVVSAQFNRQLDEEASEVSLTITMRGRVLAYDASALENLMSEVAKDVVPDDFELDEENLDYEVAATSSDDPDRLNLQVKLRSSISVRLSEDNLKNDLSGMRISQAESYLEQINDIKSYEIILSPRLPGVFLRIPSRTQNIKVEIER